MFSKCITKTLLLFMLQLTVSCIHYLETNPLKHILNTPVDTFHYAHGTYHLAFITRRCCLLIESSYGGTISQLYLFRPNTSVDFD